MAGLGLVIGEAVLPVLDSAPIPAAMLERMSEGVGLPGGFVEDPFGFVPLHAVEHLLCLIQRRVGDPVFLFRSIDLSRSERVSGRAIANVPLPMGKTGFEAVRGFAGNSNASISSARFLIEVKGDRLWMLRTSGATEWSDAWPVVQYNLTFMLMGMRRLFGEPISPIALRLKGVPAREELPEELSDLPIELSKDNFGLAFALGDIGSHDLRRLDMSASSAARSDAAGDDLTLGALEDFLSKLISSGDRLSDRAARAFGMTTRSYRRRLALLGVSHNEIVADIRLRTALRLLRETDVGVSGIAGELGYAFPGDFTRFFARRTGLSPSAYRRLALPNAI
ncbi:MAG: hypothetical protein AcusKO_44710 [Acuticoccus sp.]